MEERIASPSPKDAPRRAPPPPPPHRASRPASVLPSQSPLPRRSVGTRVAHDIIPERKRERVRARFALVGVLVIMFAAIVQLWPGKGEKDAVAHVAGGTQVELEAAAAGCGSEAPPVNQTTSYTAAPEIDLDRRVDYRALVYTSCGDMEIDLLEKRAPIAVNNFIFLARAGFYNGLTWHRVSYNYLVQAGDPDGLAGNRNDDAGYSITDELPSTRRAYKYGAVGMVNEGVPDSGGSQFFIVAHDVKGALRGKATPIDLDPSFTVFGRIDKRYFGSIESIARQQVASDARPVIPIYIERIEIIEK